MFLVFKDLITVGRLNRKTGSLKQKTRYGKFHIWF